MNVNVYLDESGDEGWRFDKLLGQGGSSRFYVYAVLIIPAHLGGRAKTKIKYIYSKYKFSYRKEIKGSSLRNKVRADFSKEVVKLLENNPLIKIRVVVLQKKFVPTLLRNNTFDIICNHMAHLGITNLIDFADNVHILPDEKSIASTRIFAAQDYLKSRTWFDQKNVVDINYEPKNSKDNYNLIFVDWIANTFWRFFENKKTVGYDILKKHIDIVHLTF